MRHDGRNNDMPSDYTVDFLRMRSGASFHFLDPKPEEISIHDIAWGLSHQNRWNGQTEKQITVAEHSVRVCRLLRNTGGSLVLQLQGLLHDAAEAYTGDIPAPIKHHLPDLMALEMLIEKAIFDTFCIPYPLPSTVKIADQQMGRWEARDLMDDSPCLEPTGNPPILHPWPPDEARNVFLATYFDLQYARRLEEQDDRARREAAVVGDRKGSAGSQAPTQD